MSWDKLLFCLLLAALLIVADIYILCDAYAILMAPEMTFDSGLSLVAHLLVGGVVLAGIRILYQVVRRG